MRVTEKGQVTIPKAIRDHLGIRPGTSVDFVRERDAVRLVVDRAVASQEERLERFRETLERMAGTVDADGMDGKEYIDWLRGPREDLDPD